MPYTSAIKTRPKEVQFDYKGGSLKLGWTALHSILFYGDVCALESEFLDRCRRYQIPICIHRRNVSRAVWVVPSVETNVEDMLSKQITLRLNAKSRLHIARRLIWTKFNAMSWLVPQPLESPQDRQSIDALRALEAGHAKMYWDTFFARLGTKGESRRQKNPTSAALDAVSKFLHGIFMRWIVYHHLSPFHGFMHVPTSYPALVYDLMEPYRGYVEKRLFEEFTEVVQRKKQVEVAAAITALKELLNSKVYCPTTRQVVTFQELFHGAVLALLAYMRGDTKRFIVPVPGRPRGGRPIKAGYRLYGRAAGKTDFWDVARAHAYENTPT